MVYTVTFNPAIDVVVSVDELASGEINRTTSQEIYYGGKGVNVSYVLRTLGTESTVMGFLAGRMGHALEEALAADGFTCDFVHLEQGETRINTKIRAGAPGTGLVETALNAGGPQVDADALVQMHEKFAKLADGDMLVVSGGAPAGVPSDDYARILQELDGSGVMVVVDATGSLLTNTLPYHPFLIKPNDEELAEIVGCDPKDYDALLAGARELQAQGAVNVLISRGGDGAFLIDEQGELHESGALKGTLVNSVGAGDSTVAGFVRGYLESHDYAHAFKMALVCGAATAFSEGLAPRETIDELLKQ